MQQIIEAYKNRKVVIHFDYQPPEPQTLEHPGCDEEITLTGVEWEDTRKLLTESEQALLEENYGDLEQWVVEHFDRYEDA